MRQVPQFAGYQLCNQELLVGSQEKRPLPRQPDSSSRRSPPRSGQVSMTSCFKWIKASYHHASRDTNLWTHCLGIPAIVARSLVGMNDLSATGRHPMANF